MLIFGHILKRYLFMHECGTHDPDERQVILDNIEQYGCHIDNEVKGEGNQQDYGMRIYDPRVGRFLSVDPITQQYPELTPYQFASNNPVWMIDIDGLEGATYQQWQRLTSEEKKLITTHPQIISQLQRNRDMAFQRTGELFTGTKSEQTGFLNDEADAFRHAYFNALNTQSFGRDLANKLGKAHEALDDPDEVRTNQKKMDLHNNTVGQDIGAANPEATPMDLSNSVEDQRRAGQLVVVKDPTDLTGNSPLVPSNKQNTKVFLRDSGATIIEKNPTDKGGDNTRLRGILILIPEKIKN